MLDVLEFYTDRQKREAEMEELGGMTPSMSRGASTGPSASLSPYDSPSAPRFNAGTGFAGSAKPGPVQAVSAGERPGMSRQDSAPTGLNGAGKSSTAIAAARAAEIVNGAHAQHANTISAGGSTRTPLPMTPGSLQATRPAPPAPQQQRPLLAGRPAPPTPKPTVPDHTPTSQDLRMRAKAQGPQERVEIRPPDGYDSPIPARKDSLPEGRVERGDREREDQWGARPPMAPSKSSPATAAAASQPVTGAAGATVGPPPVKPLQTTKKLPKDGDRAPPAAVTVTAPKDEPPSGSVAAAAAALEKPKEKERRISTMTDGQIMEKLRSVVCPDDPKALYSKIKKIGQGYVDFPLRIFI